MLLVCPYCSGKCNFKVIWCAEANAPEAELPSGRFRSGVRNVVMQCDNNNCSKYVFILADGEGLINSMYPLSGYKEKSTGWGAGLEWKIGGHVFQIFALNSFGLPSAQYLPGGDLSLSESDFRFGFSVFRLF